MEIRRDIYLDKLISKKYNKLIKVITGIRRCGKSYLLFNLFRDHLASDGVSDDHIIEMAFDLYDLLNFGLNDDSVKGVIVNPFGKFYPFGKDILRTFIEKCEEWAVEDGIEIPRADAR